MAVRVEERTEATVGGFRAAWRVDLAARVEKVAAVAEVRKAQACWEAVRFRVELAAAAVVVLAVEMAQAVAEDVEFQVAELAV